MKRTLIPIVTLGWLLAAGGIAAAQDTNTNSATNVAPSLDFRSFDVVATRNIFDQNRRGPARIRVQTRQPVVEAFTLVGTMSYEKGNFAFFDSNRSEYRKTLKASDTIAGYKIADIAPDGIKLAAASNQTINLPVGTQMRRVDGGRWSFRNRAESIPDTAVAEPSPAASDAGAPSAPSGGADSDVMKRLMLKRLQEK